MRQLLRLGRLAISTSEQQLATTSDLQHLAHQIDGAGDWIGALVVLGLAGAVIQATTSTPVLSAPPVTYANPVNPSFPPPAPAEAHYFCASVRQFYPDTRYCPEGWQLLTPAR